MDLRSYLSVLARRRYMIAAVFVATLACALAVTLLQPEKWRAAVTLRVEPGSALVGGTVQADDVKYLDRVVNTYSRLATSTETRDRAARELRLTERPDVDFTQLANTNLVEVGVTTTGRTKAPAAANRVASLLIAEVRTLGKADERAAEKAFTARTRPLEQQKARAEARLGRLERNGNGGTQRAHLLREQATGATQRLAALREDHERYSTTLGASSRALTVVTRPTNPEAPVNRNMVLTLGLALLLAAVAGPGLAFVSENLARRFRSGDEIEASVNAPVLTAVPMAHGAARRRRLFDNRSPAEEAIGRLRTTLLLRALDDGHPVDALRTILVTSAHPGDGKSTVVANLGHSLVQAGRRTLLVDADLRRPVLHRFFGLTNERGLADLLRAEAEVDPIPWSTLVRATGIEGLALLPAGQAVGDTATQLGSPWTSSAHFTAVAEEYHYVLVDSPAVLTVPDALAMVRNVRGVLLVAGSNVQRDALRLAHQELTRGGASMLGIVINGAGDRGMYPYLDYGPVESRERTAT
jgi:capsular exopolysaccharide synthesis family protein